MCWHAIQNGDPYIIKDHIIIILTTVSSVLCLFYQHAAQDIDIYFPESLLFTGQGLKE